MQALIKMRINALNSFNNVKYVNFTNNSASKNSQKSNNQGIEHDKENPISKPLEQLDVVKASLIAGFGFGARALYYLFDDRIIIQSQRNMYHKALRNRESYAPAFRTLHLL